MWYYFNPILQRTAHCLHWAHICISKLHISKPGKLRVNSFKLHHFSIDFHSVGFQSLQRAPATCCTYRGDGVDGVHDGEEKNVINASGVVRVPRPGNLLAGRIVDEGWVASDVHLVVCSVSHSCRWPVHVLVLHQSLAFVRHHNHITETNRKLHLVKWFQISIIYRDWPLRGRAKKKEQKLDKTFIFTWWLQILAGPPQGRPPWLRPSDPGHEPPPRAGSCAGLRIPTRNKTVNIPLCQRKERLWVSGVSMVGTEQDTIPRVEFFFPLGSNCGFAKWKGGEQPRVC